MPFGTLKADGLLNSNGDTVDLTVITSDTATTSALGYMSAADKTKLDGVEAGAQANVAMTGADIKTAYEAEADTNAFTDADKTKLDGLDGTLPIATQAEAEAGTNNTKVMTPLRVAQAIAALGGSVISSIQRGTIAMNGTDFASATITSVDMSKTMISHLGATNNLASSSTAITETRLSLQSSTQLLVSRASGTGINTTSYEVIEFN